MLTTDGILNSMSANSTSSPSMDAASHGAPQRGDNTTPPSGFSLGTNHQQESPVAATANRVSPVDTNLLVCASGQEASVLAYKNHCVDNNQIVGHRAILNAVTNIVRKDLFRIVKFYKATKSKRDTRIEAKIKSYLQRQLKATIGQEQWLTIRTQITKSLRTRRCTSVEALKKLVIGKQQ